MFAGKDRATVPEDGRRARVLVVDDSALMRKMISEMLANDLHLEVVGTARNGEDGLSKARLLAPDVITLDVEMPRMNGIEFLEILMRERPTPVVMISSLTTKAADITLACLQRGAVDVVAKPSGSISLDLAKCAAEIVEKVRDAVHAQVRPLVGALPAAPRLKPPQETALCSPFVKPALQKEETVRATAQLVASHTSSEGDHKQSGPIDSETVIVTIASSTGGPLALQEMLPHLPAAPNVAYLLVQHLPAGFTRSLADRMNRLCALAVREAEEGEILERGTLLIAPGGKHLEVNAKGMISLNDSPPLWGVRPAADVMMRSVAAHFGPRTVGVVLTGMGRDGALGAKAIRSAGGYCLAQNEATCVVYGMPRAAFEAGGVDQLLSLSDIADAVAAQIGARLRRTRVA